MNSKNFTNYQFKLLVIGDVMLDEYIYGNIERMSPEAPVPIVHYKESEKKLGGAANVANNLKELGADPYLLSMIGNDENGSHVTKMLTSFIGKEKVKLQISEKPTTVKTRVIANGKQVVRIDREDLRYIEDSQASMLANHLDDWMNVIAFDGIIIQDYNKGLLSKAFISSILSLSQQKEIPIFVDPKKENFWEYKGVELFKPNKNELIDTSENSSHSLEEMVEHCFNKLGCKNLMVTLAHDGIYFKNNQKSSIQKTQALDNPDVCGAGDTTLAALTLGHLSGMDVQKNAQLGNSAGYIACQKEGVSTINLEDIKRTL